MSATPRERSSWLTARGELSLDAPRIMGIVNVTPDSFWSGGRSTDTSAALSHAEALLEQGADILDVGGESTRPGARSVSAAEELERILPVIRGIVQRWPETLISVDTVKAEVASAVLSEGVAIINDVSGLRIDAEVAGVAARANAGLVLMHSRGSVENMARYEMADYGVDPVGEMVRELQSSVTAATNAGVAAETIVLDPGLGFSKHTEHTVATLVSLDQFLALGYPVLVGPSRKRFIGELSGGLAPEDRLEGTIAACIFALLEGARIFRVHDVQPVRRALVVAEALRRAQMDP
jgi:dihydropteroate synthase